MINEIFFESDFLFKCVWQSSLCIGLGLLASLIYKGRASRAHRVLLLAMTAAVIVPVISALVKHYELGLFVINNDPIQIEARDLSNVKSYAPPEFVASEEMEYTPSAAVTTTPAAAINQPQRIYIPWRSIVTWGWFILSFILLLRLLVTFILGIRLLGRAESLNCEKIQAAASIARAKLGLSKSVEVYKSSEIRSPVIWCWSNRPRLLVPSDAENSGKAIDWVSVLCHELAHWNRRDHISGLLAEMIVCIFPWNPLMWWAKRRMVSLSEEACDDWVLAIGQVETNYAQSLLDLAPQGRMAFVPAVVGSKKTLVERIRRILKGECDKPKTGKLWVLAVSTVVIFMVLGIALAQTRQARTESDAGQRVLHFPKNRSLGELKIKDAATAGPTKEFYNIGKPDWWMASWEYIGQAKGDVVIPAGKVAALRISKPEQWRDLAPLRRLEKDDLYLLNIEGSYERGPRPGDASMRHIAHLTGLKRLEILYPEMTARGIQPITRLTSLETLLVAGGFDDAGLAVVSKMPHLKNFYIWHTSYITNAGMRYIGELKQLEELVVSGDMVGDEGLVHLSKLPRLRYLHLYGKRFTDDGMRHLKNIPNLKTLQLYWLKQLTDKALLHIAECDNLETVSFHHNENITDKGVKNLSTIKSLKRLYVHNSLITDEGLKYLSQIKTLEELSLPYRNIGDQGLVYLSNLVNLKHLSVTRDYLIDPEMDKGYYTDEGVKALSKLSQLEELSIGSRGMTDESMEYVSMLTNLKSLSLGYCMNITDKGIAKLKALKSLEHLDINHANMSISGLSALNNLFNLKRLYVEGLIQDDSILDISGMTKLEKLSLKTRYEEPGVICDEDLACLANLKDLKDLYINCAKQPTRPMALTDKGLAYLESLTKMEDLGIGGILTDEGLKYLRNMKNMWRLNIYGGRFTDKGLRHLEGFKKMRMLTIYEAETNFNPQALQRLRERMPILHTLEIGEMGGGTARGMGGGR